MCSRIQVRVLSCVMDIYWTKTQFKSKVSPVTQEVFEISYRDILVNASFTKQVIKVVC